MFNVIVECTLNFCVVRNKYRLIIATVQYSKLISLPPRDGHQIISLSIQVQHLKLLHKLLKYLQIGHEYQ